VSFKLNIIDKTMKTLSNPFIIFAFIFLQTTFVLSQNHNTVVTPQKYNFSFSVMGGESIFSDRFILTDDSYSRAQPNLNVSATYYLSDSKALKVDAGYTFTKPYSGVLVDGVNYSVGSSKMFSSKLSFLVGRFKPNEHFMYNFSLGLGVHYWRKEVIRKTQPILIRQIQPGLQKAIHMNIKRKSMCLPA